MQNNLVAVWRAYPVVRCAMLVKVSSHVHRVANHHWIHRGGNSANTIQPDQDKAGASRSVWTYERGSKARVVLSDMAIIGIIIRVD
jgi:hypothetical protein